jgi:hypothetical protein
MGIKGNYGKKIRQGVYSTIGQIAVLFEANWTADAFADVAKVLEENVEYCVTNNLTRPKDDVTNRKKLKFDLDNSLQEHKISFKKDSDYSDLFLIIAHKFSDLIHHSYLE